MSELRIDNVMMVLDDDVIHGSLRAVDGIITDIDGGGGGGAATDFLLPGLVVIHTDALEGHLRPRPQSLWRLVPRPALPPPKRRPSSP